MLLMVLTGCYAATQGVDVDTGSPSDESRAPDSAEREQISSSDADTGRDPGNNEECEDGERRCSEDILQYCWGDQWEDIEDCSETGGYCISHDECGFCATEACPFVDVRCYSLYEAECGPTCIIAYLDLEALAETCTFSFDWESIPGQLGVTKGCSGVGACAENPSHMLDNPTVLQKS